MDSSVDMQASSRIIKRAIDERSRKLQLLTAIYWRGWATARPIDMLRPEASQGRTRGIFDVSARLGYAVVASIRNFSGFETFDFVPWDPREEDSGLGVFVDTDSGRQWHE